MSQVQTTSFARPPAGLSAMLHLKKKHRYAKEHELAVAKPRPELFTKLIEKDAAEPIFYFNRGYTYQKEGDLKRAIADYDQAINLDATLTFAYYNRGLAYFAEGTHNHGLADFDESLRRFETATQPALSELVAKALFNKGAALGALNRSEEAIAVYDDVVGRFGTATEPALRKVVAEALFNKGFMLGKLNRSEEETGVYDVVLRRFETATEPALRKVVANALVFKGDTLLSDEKQFKRACEDFRAALRLDPVDPVVAEFIQEAIEGCILEYYHLMPIQENISNDNDLTISETKLRELIARTAKATVQDLRAPNEKPFPVMSDDDLVAFRKHAKKNQWGDRQKHGWPYHTNAFRFVHVTYEYWVGRGLTREHFAGADQPLHAHLSKKISVEGMPEWLDVPSGPEARARAIADPAERTELEVVRAFHRKRMQQRRAANHGD